MSMRLKGMLMNHLHAQLEQHLFGEAVVLHNVPCTMTFQTAQGYMEFENETHSYLPVFHMIGSVKEIRGEFPFNISSLYFGDEDKQYLTKDILYYPNPQEIAHMITVGKFYTKRFKIPEILDVQEYSFPAKVNLTIIPPPNPAAYEVATYGGDFVAETDTEKLNLPIVYVQLAGTGVTRKNDKLLDYYGIDFDDGFEIYPLTAESSGYVDPPLMMYIEEPTTLKDLDVARENVAEMYITKEEEAQMIRVQREREVQATVAEPQVTEDYQMTTQEDVIIAQAARSIEKRIAERKKENEAAKQLQETELVQESEKQDDMLDFLENTKNGDFIFVDPSAGRSSNVVHSNDFITGDSKDMETKDEMFDGVVKDEMLNMNEVESSKQNSSSNDFIHDDVVTGDVQPDELQQQADVKMDFNPEENMFVEQKKEEVKESNDGLVDENSDRVDMENMQGADVEDASLQAKLDEARAKSLAKNAAVSIQDEIVEHDENVEQSRNGDDKAGVKRDFNEVEIRVESTDVPSVNGREVPSNISDIATEYDAVKADMADSSEYQ